MRTLWVHVLLAASPFVAVTRADEMAERLRTRLEVRTALRTGANEPILATGTLPEFYQRRLFRPVWSDGTKPLPVAGRLLEALRQSERDGLRSEDYHTGAIQDLLLELRAPTASASRTGRLVDLELLLTDGFLLHASHLIGGRVDPTTFDAEWHVPPARRSDVVASLESATSRGEIERAFDALRPSQADYVRLRRALADYRKRARGTPWPEVAEGPKLALGVDDARVLQLRKRLVASGDLDPRNARTDTLFDAELELGVKAFQERHGLEIDGAVGPATLAALNVPLSERTRQIELNLERWRWLPDELGRRHILVNLPSFELRVIDRGDTVMAMRVVIGKPFRRTPVFSGTMTYLVLSPYWHVPPSIAVQDILPAVQKDPGYLAARSIHAFRGWGADAAIDAATIDWSQVDRRAFPYRFRQDPGPLNALGAVKFMFPNPYNVYLHDTPSRELFARPDRTFSSGCIRIERPLDLAEYLLGSDRWTRDAIREVVEKGEERTVKLDVPVEVHLQYWTSWADEHGTVQFRKDVYGRDALLDRALAESAAPSLP